MALHAAASDAAAAVSGAWRELRCITAPSCHSHSATPQTRCSWCRFTRPRCTATTSATRASTPRARRCPSSICCGKRTSGAPAAQQRQLTQRQAADARDSRQPGGGGLGGRRHSERERGQAARRGCWGAGRHARRLPTARRTPVSAARALQACLKRGHTLVCARCLPLQWWLFIRISFVRCFVRIVRRAMRCSLLPARCLLLLLNPSPPLSRTPPPPPPRPRQASPRPRRRRTRPRPAPPRRPRSPAAAPRSARSGRRTSGRRP